MKRYAHIIDFISEESEFVDMKDKFADFYFETECCSLSRAWCRGSCFCSFVFAIKTTSLYAKVKGKPGRTSSINRWKNYAALRRPNGILRTLNKPKRVIAAVLGMSSSDIGI